MMRLYYPRTCEHCSSREVRFAAPDPTVFEAPVDHATVDEPDLIDLACNACDTAMSVRIEYLDFDRIDDGQYILRFGGSTSTVSLRDGRLIDATPSDLLSGPYRGAELLGPQDDASYRGGVTRYRVEKMMPGDDYVFRPLLASSD